MSGGEGIDRMDHALDHEDVEALVEGWTTVEVLAIHDFLQRICERLWERHETVLLEHLLGLDRVDGPVEAPEPDSHPNLELALEVPDQPF